MESDLWGESEDFVRSLIQTLDGGYDIAGWTESYGAGGTDFWPIKTDKQGIIPELPQWVILPKMIAITVFLTVIKNK